MKYIVSVLLVMGVSGCIWNIDKPPPLWWTYFSGNGASENEIRMALLECGSSIPGDPMEYRTVADGGLNEIILVKQCMMNAGFPFSGRKDTCAGWKEISTGRHIPADVAACKPGAVIPVRSIENRLNSPYCKAYPKARLCQPDYDPATDRTVRPPTVRVKPVSIPSYQHTDRLTPQIQQDSNQQMDQLLKR